MRVSVDNGAATTNGVDWDFTSDGEIEGWTRHTLMAASTVAIPASMRGVAKRFHCQANMLGNESDRDATIRWTRGSCAVMQIVFKQNPIF